MVFQDAANGPSAQLVTEVRHCSLNPRVAPGPILTGHAHHQRGQFFACAGPTRTASFKKVHFRATSSRCQRSSVSGVTIVPSSRSAMRPNALAFSASWRRSASVKMMRRPPRPTRPSRSRESNRRIGFIRSNFHLAKVVHTAGGRCERTGNERLPNAPRSRSACSFRKARDAPQPWSPSIDVRAVNVLARTISKTRRRIAHAMAGKASVPNR